MSGVWSWPKFCFWRLAASRCGGGDGDIHQDRQSVALKFEKVSSAVMRFSLGAAPQGQFRAQHEASQRLLGDRLGHEGDV